MFAPIDWLQSILPELRSKGGIHLRRRAWIGLNGVEAEVAIRVDGDSRPAEAGGLDPGKCIVRIDGTEARLSAVPWKRLRACGAPERGATLGLVHRRQPQTPKLQSADRMNTLRCARDI